MPALIYSDEYKQLLGSFQSRWGSLECLTDYAIYKFLGVTAEQAHLITSGMLFGRKAKLLVDLLRRSDHPKKKEILTAFGKLQGLTKRDMFAHAYVRSTPTEVVFLNRSAGGDFKAEEISFTLDAFRSHVDQFLQAGAEFYAALNATDAELVEFGNAALSLSRKSSTSPGSPTDNK